MGLIGLIDIDIDCEALEYEVAVFTRKNIWWFRFPK